MSNFRNTKRISGEKLKTTEIVDGNVYFNTTNEVFYKDLEGYRTALGGVKSFDTEEFPEESIELRNNLVISKESGSNAVLYFIDPSGDRFPLASTEQMVYIPTWNDVKNKPTEFKPTPHTHPFTEIEGVAEVGQIPELPFSKLNITQENLTGTINLGETEVIQDIQEELDNLTFDDIKEKINLDTQVPPIPFDKLTISQEYLTDTIQIDETEVIKDIEKDIKELQDDLEDHEHDAGDIVSGTLPVARGGTGQTNFTKDYVLVGDGENPVKTVPTTLIQEWAMKPELEPEDVPDLPISKIENLEIRLQGIEDIAETNVQSDWTETDTTADSYIKNKPEEINLADIIDDILYIQDLASNVSENATNINTHTNQINTLNNELDTLEGRVSQTETGIDDLDSKIDDKIENLNLNNIDGTLSVSKGGTGRPTLTKDRVLVGNNEDEVKLVEQINISQIPIPKTQVTGLPDELGGLASDITANTTNITNLTTRVGTAEGEIDSLQSGLSAAQGSISTLDGKVTTNTTDIASLTTRVGTNEDDIDGIQDELNNQINIDEVPVIEGMLEDNYFKGVSLNNATFEITFTRRTGETKVIDLPLESVVVDGSYNTETKEIVLTLQNGNTIEINVADLVTGLVSIPNSDKGEASNKTLGKTGTFKVLHISKSGTITEKTMKLNITANDVLGVNLVADKVLVGDGSNKVKLVDQTPISAWAMKSNLDPEDVPDLPIGKITDLRDELDSKVDKISGKGLSTNDYTNTDKQRVAKIPTIEQNISDLESNKVDKISGKQLSTEDYTSAEKTKLSGIQTGAQKNVQSNWTETNTTADSYIQNKPTIPTIPSILTVGDGKTGTATTQRTINAKNLKEIILHHAADSIHAHDYTNITGLTANTVLGRNTDDGPAELINTIQIHSWAMEPTKPTYNYSDIGGTKPPTNAQKNSDITKAEIEAKLTGPITSHTHSYNNLSNKPTIPTIPSVMTTAEGNTGTATTQRTINAKNLKDIILHHAAPSTHSHGIADVTGLATQRLLGRYSTGTGNVQPITLGNNLTLSAGGVLSATNTVYTHPNSGVTAGTYKSVTVNAQGHVTAGTNPTTLAGYGISLSGDVTNSGNAITIGPKKVTFAKMQDIPENTVLGNPTSNPGAVDAIPLISIDGLGFAKTTDLSNYATKTELTSGLAGKSDTGHKHTTADITALTGLPTTDITGSISATDSLNRALKKLQTQINSKTNNTGTVTSVTLSGGTGISITNPNITTTGTITVALSNMNANTIKGRISSNGAPQNLTAAQVRTILNVADGAQKNVQSDWSATSGDAFIQNKPDVVVLADVDVNPTNSTIVKRRPDGSASATSFKTGSAEIKYNNTTKSIDFIFS